MVEEKRFNKPTLSKHFSIEKLPIQFYNRDVLYVSNLLWEKSKE